MTDSNQDPTTDLRQRLYDTYMDYAQQAEKARDWSAATAYQTAACLALGTAVTLSDVTRNSSLRSPSDPSSRAALDGRNAAVRLSG